MIVQAVIDPNKTKIEPQPQGSTSDGWRRTDLLITPFDRPGNLLGPELQRALSCAPAKLCRLDPKTVVDRGDGSYTLTVESAPGVASVKVKGFGGEFVVAPACDDCGVLKSVSLNARNAKEHGKLVGTITLSSPAPSNEMGGAVVYLSSSDHRLVELPETIVVPAGKTEAVFNAEVLHLVDKQPKRVRISATYGARTIEAPLLVIVEEHADAEKTKFKPDPSALRYPHRHVPK